MQTIAAMLRERLAPEVPVPAAGTSGPLGFAVALILLTGLAAGTAEDKPRLEDLRAEVLGDRAKVSFRLINGFSEEVLERVHSGIPVTFRHRITLEVRRPILPNKEIARARIETRASYDALTRQYSLERRVQIKAAKKFSIPDLVSEHTTDSTEEMQSWMSEFEGIEVYDPARTFPDGPLKLQAESVLGRKYVLLIFPSTYGASAEALLER
jgi:hypothetical protein